ncbi:MAG: FHA domain-containing protein [Coriobacteriia bacterium]|nr:FHA domain-containing protein [Coriobacteriia bacterium]MCL2749598.1 FHA domain-containing protein [Coriobacteriia bacterium]
MIDLTLLVGRILLILLLFLFLFAVMRTGVGLVKGQTRKGDRWTIAVERGPRELRGVKMPLNGPLVVGRSPGSDIVINADYVSSRHARFALFSDTLVVEDLGSTNGTLVDGRRITAPATLEPGSLVSIGDVTLRIGRS